MLSCKYCEFFHNPYFKEQLRTAGFQFDRDYKDNTENIDSQFFSLFWNGLTFDRVGESLECNYAFTTTTIKNQETPQACVKQDTYDHTWIKSHDQILRFLNIYLHDKN